MLKRRNLVDLPLSVTARALYSSWNMHHIHIVIQTYTEGISTVMHTIPWGDWGGGTLSVGHLHLAHRIACLFSASVASVFLQRAAVRG